MFLHDFILPNLRRPYPTPSCRVVHLAHPPLRHLDRHLEEAVKRVREILPLASLAADATALFSKTLSPPFHRQE
jgi:hypothetical protein